MCQTQTVKTRLNPGALKGRIGVWFLWGTEIIMLCDRRRFQIKQTETSIFLLLCESTCVKLTCCFLVFQRWVLGRSCCFGRVEQGACNAYKYSYEFIFCSLMNCWWTDVYRDHVGKRWYIWCFEWGKPLDQRAGRLKVSLSGSFADRFSLYWRLTII